jgi:hypothetical protein
MRHRRAWSSGPSATRADHHLDQEWRRLMGFLSDIGLGFLDSGSSSASVSSTVNLEIKGLDNMKQTLTLAGETTINEHLTVDPTTVTLNENIDLKPIELKPVTFNENIDLKPVTVNENVDLKPVTLNENIDLKPVAVDTCQTYRLAPLPDTNVCQPYHHHVSYAAFGVEYWAATYDGESTQRIVSPDGPRVVERLPHQQSHQPRQPRTTLSGRGVKMRILDDPGPDARG